MGLINKTYTLIAWLLVFLVLATAGTVPVYARDKPRSIRGFKNHALSTARGFGKRSDFDFRPSPSATVEVPQMNERNSVPVEWFSDELQDNLELARLVVQKFIDSNKDGELSADELLRPLMDKPSSY